MGCAICSPEGRWLEVNDTLCAILGYSREELTGLTWQELTPATELEAELEACRALLEREDAQTWGAYEKRYIRKDGGLVDIALSAQGIRDSQGPGEICHFGAARHYRAQTGAGGVRGQPA